MPTTTLCLDCERPLADAGAHFCNDTCKTMWLTNDIVCLAMEQAAALKALHNVHRQVLLRLIAKARVLAPPDVAYIGIRIDRELVWLDTAFEELADQSLLVPGSHLHNMWTLYGAHDHRCPELADIIATQLVDTTGQHPVIELVELGQQLQEDKKMRGVYNQLTTEATNSL